MSVGGGVREVGSSMLKIARQKSGELFPFLGPHVLGRGRNRTTDDTRPGTEKVFAPADGRGSASEPHSSRRAAPI